MPSRKEQKRIVATIHRENRTHGTLSEFGFKFWTHPESVAGSEGGIAQPTQSEYGA
jgi:hypothetical protein